VEGLSPRPGPEGILVTKRAAISVIREVFTDDLVVSEEDIQATERGVSGKWRWYLDPLDGTTNYLRYRPHWCVSLALVDSTNSAVCAAVLAPPTDDLFLAVRGEGATCNGEDLRARECGSLDRAVIGSGFLYSFEDLTKLTFPSGPPLQSRRWRSDARELLRSIYVTWLGADSMPSGK
jgi:fructose-1,6-bisphosphatase/inositol monophosphatase family enzyme